MSPCEGVLDRNVGSVPQLAAWRTGTQTQQHSMLWVSVQPLLSPSLQRRVVFILVFMSSNPAEMINSSFSTLFSVCSVQSEPNDQWSRKKLGCSDPKAEPALASSGFGPLVSLIVWLWEEL